MDHLKEIRSTPPPHGVHIGHPLSAAGFYPIDTETFPISRHYRYPDAVIMQIGDPYGTVILEMGIPERRALAEDWLTKRLVTEGPRAVMLVGINIKYDMIVLAKEFPHLQQAIWNKYEAGQIMDLSTVHKVLNLFEFGELNADPTGRKTKKASGDDDGYSEGMLDLLKFYFDEDREKTDARYNFEMVYGQPATSWMPNFVEYANADGWDTLRILEAQLKRIDRLGAHQAVLGVCPRRALMHFALGWMTEFGMRVHGPTADRIYNEVEESLAIEKFPLLVESGIIEPAVPSQPRFTKAGDPVRKHVDGCPRKKGCSCPQAWSAAKDEKKSLIKLREHVLAVSRATGTSIKLTDKGQQEYRDLNGEPARNLDPNHPLIDTHRHWICTDDSVYTRLSFHDPVLREYAKRSETAILRTAYTSRFYWDYVNEAPAKGAPKENLGYAERLHFDFNDLVSTGRTSAFASKLYPSMQGQNPDPRVRPALVADPGHILLSTDYGSLELCAVADKMVSLGIRSRLAELYIQGKDPHAYLAAGLIKQLGNRDEIPAEMFSAIDPDDEYEVFLSLKKTHPKLYKFWRMFAKPTGLGAWGAMGKLTMAVYSRSMPGLEDVTPEQCGEGIKVWRKRFPEYEDYFGYIRTHMRDEAFERPDSEGNIREKYWYQTFDGLVRRDCVWSVVCNNFGLQAPGAEGASRMVPRIVRACLDPTLNSPLYGCTPLSFLHDEKLTQVPIYADYSRTQAAIDEQERIMVDAMQEVLRNVPVKVESVVMYAWDKFAAEARTPEGWLVPADPVPTY